MWCSFKYLHGSGQRQRSAQAAPEVYTRFARGGISRNHAELPSLQLDDYGWPRRHNPRQRFECQIR
jgi:hypothetical protein